MKLNQTVVISCVILVVSVVVIAQFISVSKNFSNWHGPTARHAKTKMVLPIKAVVEDASRIQEQKKLVEKVESNMIASVAPLADVRPSDQAILSEVARDPHQVPASLLDFSVLVSGKMNQAKKNYVYAEALFSEFKHCAVENADGAFQNLALRAYCLANAKRLVAWYPVLMNQWHSLSSQVSRQLMDLVDLTQG